jgi:hypothetical protein
VYFTNGASIFLSKDKMLFLIFFKTLEINKIKTLFNINFSRAIFVIKIKILWQPIFLQLFLNKIFYEVPGNAEEGR